MRASWLVLATTVLVALASAQGADAGAAERQLAFVVEPSPAPSLVAKPIEPVAPAPAPATRTIDITRRDGPFPPPGHVPGPLVPKVAAVEAPQIITILAVGDAGFNSSLQRVEPDGVRKNGFLTWEQATAGIAAEINGDINVMNVETVVTDRNDLDRASKGESTSYFFRSHPNGIRRFVRMGFNVAGLANNHAMDFGEAGLRETLTHMERLKADGLIAHAGLGLDDEQANRPQAFAMKGVAMAFASTGIVTLGNTAFRAGPGKPGQSAYQHDFDIVLDRLARADARYRILAIHHGANGEVATDDKQIEEWREQAVIGRGIDLVIGHHPHVIRGRRADRRQGHPLRARKLPAPGHVGHGGQGTVPGFRPRLPRASAGDAGREAASAGDRGHTRHRHAGPHQASLTRGEHQADLRPQLSRRAAAEAAGDGAAGRCNA